MEPSKVTASYFELVANSWKVLTSGFLYETDKKEMMHEL